MRGSGNVDGREALAATRRQPMRPILTALLGIALLATIPMAQAQDGQSRNDRGVQTRDNQDRGRGDGPRGDRNQDVASRQELAVADGRLNQIYQRRIADARNDDRTDRRWRGWYSQEIALRASERNWIAFRDSECRYLTQQDAGSRAYDGVLRNCLLDRTNERIAALRNADVTLSQR
jgi:uncharacterized protein YecT (DUF1311 family)